MPEWTKTLGKGLGILLLCVVITAVGWTVIRILGEWIFAVFMTLAFLILLTNLRKAKRELAKKE